MKYLPLMSVMLVAGHGLLGCSDDSSEPSGSAGSSASGGSASSGGKASGPGSAGKSSSDGGASAGKAGAPSMGSAGAGGAETEKNDIVETALAAGNFSQLAAALTSADLVGALQGEGPFTVFAPDDAAFDAFEAENPGVLAGLSKAELSNILTYHVVSGAAVQSNALKDEQVVVTLSGSPVLIDTTGGVTVGGAEVTTADIVASNGVIHVIDHIILPPSDDIVATALAAGTFTKLAGALTAAELVETLQGPGPFTVFAPTDAAFDELAAVPTGDALKNVLLYHVVSGAVGSGDLKQGEVSTLLDNQSIRVALDDGVTINDATVTSANIITKNGVIHVIDTVLVPE